ncbi:MAG: hypothetical protein ACFNS6_02630 [Candidatus Saccharimonas sp.]
MRPRAFERTAGGSPGSTDSELPPLPEDQARELEEDLDAFAGGTEFDESLRPNRESGDSTDPESGQESDTEYEDVKPGRESAENAAEVQANETLRTDQELLGRHYPVRQLVEKASNARKGVIEYAQASVANMKDTPKLLARHLACRFAESSYNRRKKKAEAVAHLSPKNPLRRLREKRLHKAELRFNRSKARYQSQRNQMVGRLDDVKNNMESRRKETIAKLAKRRSDALARKEIRRRLRDQGASRHEARIATKGYINSIPEDQLRHIASAIMNAAEASKNSQEASWQARYAEQASADAQNRVESIGGQLQQTRTELNSMRQQAGEIANMESDLVSVRENAAKLQEKADSLSDDSANKFAAMYEAIKAQQQQENMEKAIADYNKRLAELQRQETQLAQSLIQAQKDVENTGKALEASAQNEITAKEKAKATQQARDRSVENTFV